MHGRCNFLFPGGRSLDGKKEGIRENLFSFHENKVRRNRYDQRMDRETASDRSQPSEGMV
jgi:hypothetical protein